MDKRTTKNKTRLGSLGATAIVALGLAALPMLAGCSPTEEDARSLTLRLGTQEVDDIKTAIRQIARANIKRTNNWDAVRQQLDPLISMLEQHQGAQPAEDKLLDLEGAWRQIWSDFPYPMSFWNQMDPEQIYQVVTRDGYYYNLSDSKALGLFGLTGVLRGAYQPNGSSLDVKFTKVGFRFGELKKTEDLFALARKLESGAKKIYSIPGGGYAPKGPINISGSLENLYLDEDLRIDRGAQNDFVDGAGKVLVPGFSDRIFVLDRVTTPVK